MRKTTTVCKCDVCDSIIDIEGDNSSHIVFFWKRQPLKISDSDASLEVCVKCYEKLYKTKYLLKNGV